MAAKATTDHETIRRWAEQHGGHPAHVKGTGKGDDPGILRIDFPGFSGEDTLEPVPWEKWFEWFDRNNLALLYEEDSRFNKLVSRDTLKERLEEHNRSSKSESGKSDSRNKGDGNKSR